VELRWVEAFIAVAEELHFGRAAERLRMAQSPLSQTIRKLEKHLGVDLFDRNTRTVSLTTAGHAFLPHARRIMEELDLARRAARSTESRVYGNVRIGFSGSMNHHTVPPLTVAVRQRQPDIDLTLVGQVMTADGLRMLRRGELDLAFVGLPVNAPFAATRLIANEPLGATLPSSHPLAGADEIELKNLSDEGFITFPASQGSALRESMITACAGAGFRPHIVQEVMDPYTILSLVASEAGISLMPAPVANIMPPGSVLVPLDASVPPLRAGIAWNPEHVTPALAAVLAIAEDILPTPK
jgi:DNA-binding transcriptional LysR family regulator